MKKIKFLRPLLIHPGHNHPYRYPDLIDDAIGLFERYLKGDIPDAKSKDFESVVEYHHQFVKRLKIFVKG